MIRKEFLKKLAVLGSGLTLPAFAKNTNEKEEGLPEVLRPEPASWKPDEISISWLGHSTVLINFYGKIILTDPVLFEQVGLHMMWFTVGPARYTPPALRVEEIPKPDVILLSHAHMDHMDYRTLAAITDRYPQQIDCLTAFNTADVIQDLKWKSLAEIDWNEKTTIHGISFKALEVKHFGWRFPWERDRSKGFMMDGRSFNAYVLERNGRKILFGGDTAMTEKLKASGESAEIAIMPIGAYYPWRFNHCSPEEAMQMAVDVNAKIFIPIHCNTFKQGMEPIDEPMKRLKKAHASYNLTLGVNSIGETFRSA